MKENIKFLLGQIKKYQKSGIAIEECNKSLIVNNEIEISNRYKKLLKEKEEGINKINTNYQVELKSILEKVSNLEKEYNNLKSKYNDLKKKYNKEMELKDKEKNLFYTFLFHPYLSQFFKMYLYYYFYMKNQ